MPITHLLAQSVMMELETDPSKSRVEGGSPKPLLNEEKLVLIDTDAGTDDAWALFMAIAAHRNPNIPFRIVGITCSHGSTNVDNATVNVTRVLQTVGEANIPVFRGTDSALVTSWDLGDDPYHGEDGFGDADLAHLKPSLEEEHGVNAIIKLAEMYKGNLTILTLGPLTNLAMAVRMKPSIKHWIKEIYILGGNHEAMGNMTVLGEFNFLADAEAAHVVLEHFYLACPMYTVPWETCVQASSDTSFRVDTLGRLDTDEMALLNAIEAKILRNKTSKEGWLAADALAVAILIEPSVVKKSDKYHCTVELNGTHSRGMMVVDKNFLQQKPANCAILQDVDASLFEKMLIWAAGGPHYMDHKGKSKRVPRR